MKYLYEYEDIVYSLIDDILGLDTISGVYLERVIQTKISIVAITIHLNYYFSGSILLKITKDKYWFELDNLIIKQDKVQLLSYVINTINSNITKIIEEVKEILW